jgi:hypothetical protein
MNQSSRNVTFSKMIAEAQSLKKKNSSVTKLAKSAKGELHVTVCCDDGRATFSSQLSHFPPSQKLFLKAKGVNEMKRSKSH